MARRMEDANVPPPAFDLMRYQGSEGGLSQARVLLEGDWMRTPVLLALATIAGLSACTYECNASNCADGCCGENGVCYVRGGDAFCGLDGLACQDCRADQRICSNGACGIPCVRGSSCETSSDCCSTLICWKSSPGLSQGECSSCRGPGESCSLNEDCCGYPSQRCQRPDGFNFICR